MITWDSFSSNMYFKGNMSVLLMLLATSNKNMHLLFFITALQQSGVFLDYLPPVGIYPWLYRTPLCQKTRITMIHCCVASGQGSYLNSAYRRVYICLSDKPETSRGMWKILFEKKENKRQYRLPTKAALIIHFRGIVGKLFFVCSVYVISQSLTGQDIAVHEQRDDIWQR